MRAPFGRLLRAIREDELAVAAAGKGVLRAKVEAAALAGAFAGIAGGLYATFLSFIDPSSFDLDASILLLTMIVVGGARTLAGSIDRAIPAAGVAAGAEPGGDPDHRRRRLAAASSMACC